ncbi:hypothetical protein DFQ27_006870 [Actinomortierella ambigua]|uniref:Uncharacterized protein n=1 Tax=Actinomortierella ambigua TaxID=1343610 RepID=A0A9P6QGR5_9FUNG|nr:hypothetical protein DFQ27_006870 [Actinomortierella ambigua]
MTKKLATTTTTEENPRTKDYTNVEPTIRFEPLNHLVRPISTPEGGFARVRWTHAVPELNCNGCRLRDALCDRFRYTCRTCGPNQYDLCKFCFRQYSVARQQRAAGQEPAGPIISRSGYLIDHDTSHELVEMDLAHPDWNDPVWHQGWGPNAGQVMTQVATGKGSWGPEGHKAGDKFVIGLSARLRALRPSDDAVLACLTHVKFSGINVSKVAIKYILENAFMIEVLHVRSTPTFGGPELVSVFKEVLSEMRDYGKLLKESISALRPSQELLDELFKNPVDNGLLSKAYRWNPFKNKALKKLRKEMGLATVPSEVRVVMSMCDLTHNTTNPCGFPGLLPTVLYTGRDPVHCYNQTRDILIELLTYLGTPLPANATQMIQIDEDEMIRVRAQHDFRIGARVEDLGQERARLIEARRNKFLERVARHTGPSGGFDKMTLEWKAEVETVLASKVALWSQ